MRITVGLPKIDLAGLAPEVRKDMLLAMQGSLKLVENAAKQRVANGPKTGRIYNRRGVEHQASAPGEPPATDTGALIASIGSDAAIVGDTIDGYVRAKAPYAIHLELGTRKMAARPFLVPSIEENRRRIADLLSRALATASARFAKKG
jgi:hypothetical protein